MYLLNYDFVSNITFMDFNYLNLQLLDFFFTQQKFK